MLVSSRMPQRRPRSRRAAVATGALLLALTGCSARPDPGQSTAEPIESTAEPTPLADYETSGLTLSRSEFCDEVGDDAVTAALVGDATDVQTWIPGARLPGSTDISNEFGCAWAGGGVTARAWVFAPPVTAERADDFAEEAVDKKCERLGAAPELGRPGAAQRCREGRTATTGFHGLVGDTWVGCEISGRVESTADDLDLVGEWCVGVLEALRSP